METKKETEQAPNSGPANPTGANIPEWVMHLLTGLGTMGAEYMMFIKPLQEKMELQSRILMQQDERIEKLEELLLKRKKPKNLSEEDEENEEDENDQELFQIRRRPSTITKYNKHTHLKL